jgi:hypothetical protein
LTSKAPRQVQSSHAQRTPKLAVAPFEGFDRSLSISVPQEVIDEQLAGFTEGELKLLLAVVRATNGGQREHVALSVRALCHGGVADILPGRGTGLSPRTIQAATAALETAGFVRLTRRTAPDGSGLPSLFSLPLLMPGVASQGGGAVRFAGYAARRARLPLLVIDRLMAELSGAELKVLLYVLRHTFCVGVPDEVMPMARLVENAGLSLRHTRLAVSGLASRGFVLVQHRQDAERGKLPSRFGVRVLGETAPFSAPISSSGAPVRQARAEEPPAEAARPVWIVPTPPAEAPSAQETPVPMLQVLPQSAQTSGAAPLLDAPTPASPQPVPARAAGVSSDLSRTARPSTPPATPAIAATMLKDNHPAWAAVKQLLAARLPARIFVEWIAPTASVSLTSGTELLIAVRDEHHRWFLESKLQARIHDAMRDAGYGDLHVRYLNYPGKIPAALSAE